MAAILITFTQSQVDHLVEIVVWPMTRVLAFIAVAPLFSNSWLPTLWRLGFGLVFSWAIIPALPAMPGWPGLDDALVVEIIQVIAGLTLGFLFRFMLSVLEFAAGLISIAMGLGFATTISSQYGEESNTLSQIFQFSVVFLLIADGGLLGMLHVLSDSFFVIPVGIVWPHWNWLHLADFGQVIFTDGVLIALPVVLMLLVTTIGMGIVARVAPQMNLFSIGFPIMILVGLAGVYLSIPYFPRFVNHIFLLTTEFLYG